MKNFLFFYVRTLFLLCSSNAQELSIWKSKDTFIEWNLGVACIFGKGFPWVRTSVLWGKTYSNENNDILNH